MPDKKSKKKRAATADEIARDYQQQFLDAWNARTADEMTAQGRRRLLDAWGQGPDLSGLAPVTGSEQFSPMAVAPPTNYAGQLDAPVDAQAVREALELLRRASGAGQ